MTNQLDSQFVEMAIEHLNHYQNQPNDVLLSSIALIIKEVRTLTDAQCQDMYNTFCLMAWDRKFLIDMPHDDNNPGLRADQAKWQLHRQTTSSDILKVLTAVSKW